MGEKSGGSGGQRRVLRSYRQEGKRFIPPFLHLLRREHVNLDESEWMADRVPELIWIALLHQVFGFIGGTVVAAGIAKAAAKCNQTTKRAFAAVSDYTELSDEEQQCVLLALSADGTLNRANGGLAALINHYGEFPLAFLADREGSLGSTLDDLRETISVISDRRSVAATFAQASVVYISVINGILKISPDVSLADFPAIEDYPKTDESQRVATAIRATVPTLLRDIPPDWRISFWNQGRTLGPCEVD